ncbi:MAG: hypothetical protein V1697_02550 [Candidatus Levyibacteriota bacterium]
MSRKFLFVICFCLISLFFYSDVQAGFGISAPHIWNDRLVPGAHFEHKVTLTRSDPSESVKITIEMNAPDIESWITIDRGMEFIYPAGQQQFPINVIIDVPKDAGYALYEGRMTIKASPVSSQGSVSVAIGAIADFHLNVTGDEFSDFQVREISIPPLEEGWPLKVVVSLENIGNVKVRPSMIKLDIYDAYHNQLLYSKEITQFSWVDSFKVGQSTGEVEIDLSSAQYWAEYKLYKGEEVLLTDQIKFDVHLPGTLIPPPFLERIKIFAAASPFGLILVTFSGTIIVIGLIFGGVFILKKKMKKKTIKRKSKK